MSKLDFDDFVEKSMNILILLGAIFGAIGGFNSAGIGGAILGIIIGGIGGLLVFFGVSFIVAIVTAPLFLLVLGLSIGGGFIFFIIKVLWNVGKP